MKKILVTGCAGFIGCHVTKRFLDMGYQVVGVDNLSRCGSQINLRWLRSSHSDRFAFYKGDIRNFSKIAGIFKQQGPFDLVLHAAAQVAVTTSVLNPREDFEINALGTFNILEAVRLYSPESFFEYASTNKVYGEMSGVEIVERNGRYEYERLRNGIDEARSIDFHSPYGCSKGAADQYVRDYSRIYGMRTVVLRQSCIYGTRQFGVEDQGWISWFVIASLLGRKVTIYGDGKQSRDVLWIDDLIDAYVGLYEHQAAVTGQILNVGGGSGNIFSLRELVRELMERKLMGAAPECADWRAGDQKTFVSDISKITKLIGWVPRVGTSEGLGKIIDWSRENKVMLEKVFKKNRL